MAGGSAAAPLDAMGGLALAIGGLGIGTPAWTPTPAAGTGVMGGAGGGSAAAPSGEAMGALTTAIGSLGIGGPETPPAPAAGTGETGGTGGRDGPPSPSADGEQAPPPPSPPPSQERARDYEGTLDPWTGMYDLFEEETIDDMIDGRPVEGPVVEVSRARS